ncbi:hypothetical protein L7F22_064569 [Adiantum nelumboides]|nr:hypothetical protein [Adiantum nelumboides]
MLLDCIGSAFNAKGRMQCPNCRGVEQGRWLYANACCLNEDLVEDSLLQQETEVYRTAGVSLNLSPWCPHQGLYEHISLTFEELMNLGHRYADSLRSSLHRQRICPCLVGVHNIPIQSRHTESSMSLGLNNLDGSSSYNVPRGEHHVHDTRLRLSSHSGSRVPYNQNGPNFHPNQSHQMFGFLSGSPQSTYVRFGEETNSHGQQSTQQIHNQGDQMIGRHSHPHTVNIVWNEQANGRRARHSEVTRTTTRPSHSYHAQRPQMTVPIMNGYPTWLGPSTSQQASMVPFVDGMHRAASGPRIAYGLPAYWWTWTPLETSHRNMATNSIRRAQRTIW